MAEAEPKEKTSSLQQKVVDFIDSFHGLKISKDNNDLAIWRVRCLVAVSWTTASSGGMLVPLYFAASANFLGFVLLAGCVLLMIAPYLYRIRLLSHDATAQLVAITSVSVMTVLTAGSGGFPSGLAPGIQRILPILVLCFGSLRLGACVTGYVILETAVFYMIGPMEAVLDEKYLELIMMGSWMLQPVILFCVGVSLHVAGSQTVEKLLAVSAAKARFLSVVSHELRTPLHGILGSCDLVLSGADADYRDAIQSCHIAAQHLSSIVEDLLLYSSSSAIRVRSEPFSITHLLHSVRATVQAMAFCPLDFQLPKIDHWFLGDELRLRQCLINVVGNAVKFCGKNGSVTVRLDYALAGEYQDDPWSVRLSVQDTGLGIAPEDLERIFAPFEQVSSVTSRSLAGVGLGLSIVADLLGKMNGRIKVESVMGKGSTFYLTVPLLRAAIPSDYVGGIAESGGVNSGLFSLVNKNPTIGSSPLPLLESSEGSDATPTIQSDAPVETVISVTPKKSIPAEKSVTTPIVVATVNTVNLTCLDDWEGESLLFEVRRDFSSWESLVESVVDETTDVDLIVFDDSVEAYDTAKLLHAQIQDCTLQAIPMLRIADNSLEDDGSSFDATIHSLAIPALIRSWYRALALGAWILVVDDVALNRKILRKLFTRLGHRVSEACNGLEGFQVAEKAGFAHDMIAMDMMMPIMDGQTAAQKIVQRERQVRGSIVRLCPIFAVTAGNKTLVTDMSVFSGFMKKPTSVKKLRCMVRHQVIRRLMPLQQKSVIVR